MKSSLVPLGLALAALGLPHAAHAQSTPAHPLGISLGFNVDWPDALNFATSARATDRTVLSPGFSAGLRYRLLDRLYVHASVAEFAWHAADGLPEFAQNGVAMQHDFVLVPLSAGVRFNVMPRVGWFQLYVGGGLRGTAVVYQETIDSTRVGAGGGFTLGAFGDVAVEVLKARRVGVEFFARYTLGFVPTHTGVSASRYDDFAPLGGLTLGVAVNYYLF